jgi:transcriptional regulator with XRE-family HTH domain
MAVEVEDEEYTQFLKTLGSRIKQLRKERGYSLRDMVIHHGYNDSQWRRYERGGSINVHSLLKIAKLFGISLSTLLDGLAEYPQTSIQEIKKQHRAATSGSPKAKKKVK